MQGKKRGKEKRKETFQNLTESYKELTSNEQDRLEKEQAFWGPDGQSKKCPQCEHLIHKSSGPIAIECPNC